MVGYFIRLKVLKGDCVSVVMRVRERNGTDVYSYVQVAYVFFWMYAPVDLLTMPRSYKAVTLNCYHKNLTAIVALRIWEIIRVCK